MRRTVLSATALAFTAVLATALPAFADDTTPTAVPKEASQAPTPAPSAPATDHPAETEPTKGTDATDASPVPSQVSVVPSGAPDTGTAPKSEGSGSAVLAGTGATALLLGGGAAVVLVRRKRANEA
ncbi:Tat pathway signal sequence domain protein [Streptomyces deccanensis]|uniref:Tat pathway signal sequence domain protein n=1 Tax=Streptomyces deccanensis TaxID=424188 RepID=UPI001EFAC1F0|nr:Tat pathway signal sequence domain protein [Streptomyces deccanensis]ULR54015.1 Tat pathway signal sequence domain protein [Streptomyces deccanensis]